MMSETVGRASGAVDVRGGKTRREILPAGRLHSMVCAWAIGLGLLLGLPSVHAQGLALKFNGTNQRVTFGRSISNDFTIEFWFKSTQVAGADANWYNGMGLVDAEVSGITDDFGVSFGGGKVLFGVGRPDTTVRSGSLADGAWH